MNLTAAFAAREGDFPLYGFCGACRIFIYFKFKTTEHEANL